MAKGRIDSIADVPVIEREVTFIKTELTAIINQFGQYAIAINNVNTQLKASQGMAEYNKAIKEGIILSKEANNAATQLALNTNKLEVAEQRLTIAKNNTAMSDIRLAAAQKKASESTIDETKSIEDQIKASKRQVNSIKAVEEESRKLNQIKKNLNLDSAKDRQLLEGINRTLDKNTQFLRENGDQATKQRMNIGNYGSMWSSVGSILGRVGAALGITGGAMAAVKKIIQATDTVSDKFTETQYALNNALDYTAKAIATMDFSNFWTGLANAAAAGRELAMALDRIEEKGMAVGIIQARNNVVIEKYTNLASNANVPKATQLQYAQIALNLAKENNELDLQQAKDKQDALLKNAAALSGLNEIQIQSLILDRQYNQQKVSGAKDLSEALEEQDKTFAKIITKDATWYAMRKDANALVNKATDSEIAYAKQVGALGKLNSDQQKELSESVINYYNTVAKYDTETRRLQKKESNLSKGIIEDEENKYKSTATTYKNVTDDRNKYLLEAQKRYQESQINLMQDAEAQEKARINLKFKNELDDLEAKNVLSTELEASLLAERDKELTAITVKYAKERVKSEQDGLKQAYAEYTAMVKGDNEQRGKYTQLAEIKEISEIEFTTVEEYEQKKAAIIEKYQRLSLEAALKAAEDLVNDLPPKSEARINAEKEVLDAKIALGKFEIEANEAKNKAKVEDEKEAAEKIKQINKDVADAQWETAAQLFDTLGSISDSYYDNQTSKIELQEKKDSEAKEKELERAGDNAEVKESIEKRYDALEKKREKEKQEIELKKAKWEKANALFVIALNTAKAISEHLATPALIPYDIAMGALQAAVVLSKPLPKYFKGRSQGRDEFAIVGDSPYSEGATEAVKIGNKMFLTPAKPTLTFLPKEAEVIPNKQLMQMTELASMTKLPVWEGGNMNTKELERKITELNKGFAAVVSAINNRPEFHSNVTEKGMEYMRKKGKNITIYLDKNVLF